MGDRIAVQLSSLHWPQINTYAMHKILVTTGYWNDNADNCLNVLQPSAREMIKMTSRGSGMGRGEGRQKDDEDICLFCVRILNDQWIQWSNAMQNSAVHFINERAGQRRVESTMMTRPNNQNGAKQKANHSQTQNQQHQKRNGRRGNRGKATAKTVSNEIPMKTREPLDYEFVCMQTGVNFY